MKNSVNSLRESAVALIIVLAMLLLLSGLIVSFMTSVSNERAASVASNNQITTRQLADSTVNLVIGQIRQATTQAEAASVPTTWASQPGAIRTFSGRVGNQKNVPTAGLLSATKHWTYRPGTNDYIFKLYSAENMKVQASDIEANGWFSNETTAIESWDFAASESERENDPKIGFGYTDLNSPVMTALPSSLTKNNSETVQPRYPILDPRAKFSVSEKPNSTPDPGVVDGFDIKTSKLDDKNLKTLAGTAVQYLPMPVKWLYVMRDGSMAAADSKTGKIPGATLDNPIVGRTAFWTDDESCKLNINTASEGTYWDTPTASSVYISGNVDDSSGNLSGGTSSPPYNFSLNLGASQPVRGEYNRYPGHPATTSLSPVLGWMGLGWTGTPKWGILPTELPRATRDSQLINTKEAILQLSPFNPNWIPTNTKLGNTSRSASYNADGNMPTDQDAIPQLNVVTKRLYTTVDEMIFKADRNNGSLTVPTKLNNEAVTPEKLEKVRFFLTANSRSPELNLFGRPRVTFWPVNTHLEQRTGFDDLFAFTSTLYKDPNGNRDNDKAFYFTRYDAKSAINDFVTTPVGEPRNKNEDIMQYLRLMTGGPGPFTSIPGFGGSFAAKYPGLDPGIPGAERNQILKLIFDYCRSVNLVDTSKRTRAGVAYRPYTPFFGKGSGYQTYSTRSHDWSGQVTPIRFEGTNFVDVRPFQGLGRFPTIAEAAIIFYRTAGNPQDVRAALIFEMTTPMAGNPAIRETMWMTVERGADRPEDGTEVGRPTLVEGKDGQDIDIHLAENPNRLGEPLINIVNVASHDVGWGRGYMPALGFMNQVHYYPEPAAPTTDTSPDQVGQCTPKRFTNDNLDSVTYRRRFTSTFYPFVSDPIKVSALGPNLKFKGGKYLVKIYSGEAPDDARSTEVQRIWIEFPAQQVAFTGLPTGADLGSRLNGQQNGGMPFPTTADFVRSVEYVGAKLAGGNWVPLPLQQQGDFRLAMARNRIPPQAFAPRSPGLYFQLNQPRIHALQQCHGDPYAGYTPGTPKSTFAVGAPIRTSKPPILPDGINGVQMANGAPGDWDRGLSKHMDGALGGKVDEGNVWFDYSDSSDGGKVPYFRGRGIEETGRSFFSPNRQLASAVMFGSLPTGVVRNLPYQTLLFRPDRSTIPHPGAQTTAFPADHLLLDLFNLPVVEPYAISEPFSTGGKVNLNYVIAPFGYARGDAGRRKMPGNNVTMTMDRSYIRRDTALRGIFKAVKMMAVPTGQASGGHTEGPVNTNTPMHFDIDAERTLDAFESRLKDRERGLFRSASEICDMDLYPSPNGPGGPPVPPVNDWGKFWDIDFAQTGDNMRERPYAHIYPRVTTKSNIFTIHLRCQAVKKVPGTEPDKFDSKRDKVLGEYRGQATVERFIDPNDPQLKDYDATSGNSSVDPYYRFRVISTKQFLPR